MIFHVWYLLPQAHLLITTSHFIINLPHKPPYHKPPNTLEEVEETQLEQESATLEGKPKYKPTPYHKPPLYHKPPTVQEAQETKVEQEAATIDGKYHKPPTTVDETTNEEGELTYKDEAIEAEGYKPPKEKRPKKKPPPSNPPPYKPPPYNPPPHKPPPHKPPVHKPPSVQLNTTS
ncbi:hypothetical protein O6P43_021426 [Quillaja saponaria]|uniref:Uncharacterized protein n=1 Tax=Quillaja saponaria TaxID=32244 RepID=A0AAD7PH75_QUISA|nr:hypothetical protein O6P43_021426 [Quillaja saponaria]